MASEAIALLFYKLYLRLQKPYKHWRIRLVTFGFVLPHIKLHGNSSFCCMLCARSRATATATCYMPHASCHGSGTWGIWWWRLQLRLQHGACSIQQQQGCSQGGRTALMTSETTSREWLGLYQPSLSLLLLMAMFTGPQSPGILQ